MTATQAKTLVEKLGPTESMDMMEFIQSPD